jgi:hypothetical protein
MITENTAVKNRKAAASFVCGGLGIIWQGRKDSNLRMPESKSGALTSLATPLHNFLSIACFVLIISEAAILSRNPQSTKFFMMQPIIL